MAIDPQIVLAALGKKLSREEIADSAKSFRGLSLEKKSKGSSEPIPGARPGANLLPHGRYLFTPQP